MTESTRPPRTRLPLSIWAVGVIAPALVWVAAVVVQLAWLPELPDSVAIHWGADGPDGFAAPWTTIALTEWATTGWRCRTSSCRRRRATWRSTRGPACS